MRKLPTIIAALALTSSAVQAEDRVRINIKDVQTDFGNLHLSVNLLGYELGSNSDGVMSSVQGLFELGESFMVRAHAAFPFLGAVGSAKNPVRIEAGIGWHLTSFDVETEAVTLSQDYTGDYVNTKYVNVPVLNRNSRGLGVGLMYRDQEAGVTIADDDDVTTRSKALTAYLGFHFLNSAGYDLAVEGYDSSFFNYRWLNGGLDVLFDVVHDYNQEPTDDPNRFGGRVWAESIFGSVGGLSGRLEFGYMPGDVEWYFMASIGGGLHLGI